MRSPTGLPVKAPGQNTRLIGQRWKRSNACSRLVLISRGLVFEYRDDRARYGVLKERSLGFGGYGGSDPPVPIPNTEVKPASADGTWAVGPRESRSPPDITRLRPSLGAASI